MRSAAILETLQRHWRAVDGWVSAVFVLAIALIVISLFGWLDPIAADAKAATLNVAYSFVAAFVFYFLLDVVPRVRKVRALGPYVKKRLEYLKGDVIAVCREVANSIRADCPSDWEPNQRDVESWFAVAQTNGTANMVFTDGGRAQLIDYFYDRFHRTVGFLRDLTHLGSFLDAELMSRIADVQDDSYLMQLRVTEPLRARLKPVTLTFIAKDLMNHFHRLKELEISAKRSGFIA